VLALLAPAYPGAAQSAEGWVVDRRRDPFPSEESYLAIPLPYSIPGVGSGVGAVLYETNHYFPHRAYFVVIGGDVEAVFASVEQVQLVARRLLVDLFAADVTKLQVRNYPLRGMDTRSTDYQLLEFSNQQYYAPQLTLTYWERRIDLYVQAAQIGTRLERVRDRSGHVISTFTEPQSSFSRQYRGGMRLDLTDEYFDPRKGVRFVVEYTDSPRESAFQPDFYTVDTRLTGYLPVGSRSTWAFHAFQSDAIVRRTGETRKSVLNLVDNLGCQPADNACAAAQEAKVNNDLAANRNGTSTSLGGDTFLRGYPSDRFKGAHTLYVSTELRINLTDEQTPFDYFFFRDVRTGIQIAPFYEAGSVSETTGSLGARWKDDAGVGFRLVTASGSVYRADFAVGSEGVVPSVTVFYPW
jgi:hypothetical protein